MTRHRKQRPQATQERFADRSRCHVPEPLISTKISQTTLYVSTGGMAPFPGLILLAGYVFSLSSLLLCCLTAVTEKPSVDSQQTCSGTCQRASQSRAQQQAEIQQLTTSELEVWVLQANSESNSSVVCVDGFCCADVCRAVGQEKVSAVCDGEVCCGQEAG